jgi:beta-carotene 3-hydroxylase
VTLLVAATAFVVMEPVTYAMHRWVMHGRGIVWHRSHHLGNDDRIELNDRFPVIFAAMGLLTFAAGASVGSLELLIPVSMGAGAYGLAYLFVHDVYIHRRFGLYHGEVAVLERLKAAHRLHHLFGGEPYGMLLPVVPSALRRRAESVDRDPFPSAAGVGGPGRRPRRRLPAA